MRIKLAQISILNLQTGTNIYILHHHILIIVRGPIVYSLGLQIKKICSEKEDFLKHMREMKLWFLKRGYSENIVDQELEKVDFSESSWRTNKRDKGVYLVATYHQLLLNISRIFQRHLDLVCTDQEIEN